MTTTRSRSANHTIITGPTQPDIGTYANSSTVMSYAAAPQYAWQDEFSTIKRLGSSSEGIVFVVRSKATDSIMIRKVLHAHTCPAYPRTPNEVRRLKQLHAHHLHRNIVLFRAAHRSRGGPMSIYMEFCEGGDLRGQLSWLDERRMVSHTVVKAHAYIQLGSALAFLHHGLQHHSQMLWHLTPGFTPLVHGDIKPENVLLRWSEHNEVQGLPDFVLTDFGHTCEMANLQSYAGTLFFRPPEVIAWLEAIDSGVKATPLTSAVDVYTFGQTMVEIAGGEEWESGRDPDSFHLEESDCMSLAPSIRSCLETDPDFRMPIAELQAAQGSTTMLYAIDELRTQRDRLIIARGVPAPRYWKVRPGSMLRMLEQLELESEEDEDEDEDEEESSESDEDVDMSEESDNDDPMDEDYKP